VAILPGMTSTQPFMRPSQAIHKNRGENRAVPGVFCLVTQLFPKFLNRITRQDVMAITRYMTAIFLSPE
jgi:hypothetical protein